MNVIENFFTTIQQPKIYVHTPNPTISENVQNVLFNLGYHWIGHATRHKCTYNKYLVVYRNCANLYSNDYDDIEAYTIEASTFFKIAKHSTLKKLH